MALDVKDWKILKELDLDPKIPISKLAKKLRISQQVADYRIKKLLENKIMGFGTVLDLGKLGYGQYRVLFNFNNISDDDKKKVIAYMETHPKIYWAAIIGGKWDFFSVVLVKNYDEFENFLDELFTKFPKFLKDYSSVYVLHHEFYRHKYLDHENILPAISVNLSDVGKSLEIDDLDYSILKEIKSNCRASSLELGKKCNTSYKTIQNRIKKLESKGIIAGYRTFINSENIKLKPYLLLISFNNYGRDVEKKIFSFSKQNKLITQATKIFGPWSLMIHVRCKGERELQSLIIELRNSFNIIDSYEIIPVFEDVSVNMLPI
jgi:Lrp/AsnC family transcriptional regulator, leucine-responsive regulatory protein